MKTYLTGFYFTHKALLYVIQIATVQKPIDKVKLFRAGSSKNFICKISLERSELCHHSILRH